MPARPNVLFIMADQLTAMALGCYDNPVSKTPNLDALASRGVLFRNHYNNCSICTPSRQSMYSGRLAANIGCFDNGSVLPANVPTFLHHLRLADYEVVSSGKQHFVGPDQLHGYERRLTMDIYPAGMAWTKNWSAPIKPALGMVGHLKEAGPVPWTRQLEYDEMVHYHALDQIRRWGMAAQRSGGRERPFFLCASYTHPHDPPKITQEWWDLYEDVEIDMPLENPTPDQDRPLPDTWLMQYLGLDQIELTEDDVRRSRRGYYAMTSFFDQKVGELVAELDRQGLSENTIIIVTSDHGDMVGEHELWFKRSYYEWSSRVPLIVSMPGQYAEGRIVEQTTSLVDLYPTLLDMLDIDLPDWAEIDGQSAATLLHEDDETWKDEAIIDFTSAGAIHPWRAIVSGRWKYVAVHTGDPLLFDLENDPGEWHNLAGKPEVTEIEAQLKARAYEGWDPNAIEATEYIAQQQRINMQAANQRNTPKSWDFQPFDDASKRFAR